MKCSDQEIAEMYRRGVPVAAIARKCGSFDTVYRRLRRLFEEGALEPRRPAARRPRKRVMPWEAEEMARLWLSGRTLKEIAEATGRSPETVRRVLIRLGVYDGRPW